MKRYFSDHRWLVAFRHPATADIYLENSVGEEIGILRELGVDYLILAHPSPAPLDDERLVALLSRIGPGNVLEPVMMLNGLVLLRFQPDTAI